jgi:hypothetical protein
MNPSTRGRRLAGLLMALGALAVAALGVTVADAAGGPSVRSVAPKNHASYPLDTRVHFTVRARGVGKGDVAARVSSSRATRHGLLKHTKVGDFFIFSRRPHHRYTYTPPRGVQPAYMVTPGRYYWQAQVVDRSCPHVKCRSRIRSFRIRR